MFFRSSHTDIYCKSLYFLVILQDWYTDGENMRLQLSYNVVDHGQGPSSRGTHYPAWLRNSVCSSFSPSLCYSVTRFCNYAIWIFALKLILPLWKWSRPVWCAFWAGCLHFGLDLAPYTFNTSMAWHSWAAKRCTMRSDDYKWSINYFKQFISIK